MYEVGMTRVLLQIRSDAFTRPGGDTVQLEKTVEALRALGVNAEISTETEPPLTGFDLVHLFNMTSPLQPYLQAVHAKRHGTPKSVAELKNHAFIGGGVVLAPSFFYPPPVYADPPPAVLYVEPPPANSTPEPGYWYYCPDSNQYYPYAQQCPSGWQPVAPQPPPS